MIVPGEVKEEPPAKWLKWTFIFAVTALGGPAFFFVVVATPLGVASAIGNFQEGWKGFVQNALVGGSVLGTWLLPYPIPLVIAGFRKHHEFRRVLVMNLLLGWTVVGWFIALVWSVSGMKKGDSLRWLKMFSSIWPVSR